MAVIYSQNILDYWSKGGTYTEDNFCHNGYCLAIESPRPHPSRVCVTLKPLLPHNLFVDVQRIKRPQYSSIKKPSKIITKLSILFAVPGDGGSQMEAKLNKPDVVHYICQKTADYFNIWLNLELLVPLIIDCWIDNVRLIYDPLTRTTKNSPGVTTRIPGWGNPDVVEWLDPTHASAGAYFKDVGNALVAAGYVRNVSIRGAPYDFRKAPGKLEDRIWGLCTSHFQIK